MALYVQVGSVYKSCMTVIKFRLGFPRTVYTGYRYAAITKIIYKNMYSKSSPVCILLMCLLLAIRVSLGSTDYCQKLGEDDKTNIDCDNQPKSHFSRKRYILYEVNLPEGFNLRRDVYIRVATFVKHLTEVDKDYEWYLVLPPWGNLYHWQSRDIGPQIQIPWGLFFDIDSLQKFVPVLEMYEFIREYPSIHKETVLDRVIFLQNDENMFKTGNFADKTEITDCSNYDIPYTQLDEEMYIGYFWSYRNVTSRKVECVIFHGTTLGLQSLLQPAYRSIMFDHMEIPLHSSYGSKEYWEARRSMRYSSDLYKIANEFRKNYLNSTDISDNTVLPDDWTKESERRNAVGGPYLSVHLRRRDFVISHSSSIPTIESAAAQIRAKMKSLSLYILFVATDAEDDFEELKKYLTHDFKTYLKDVKILRYSPTEAVKQQFKDGGIAIIDQIICSHAKYFIGTDESTFTYRVQESREILGFPSNTTFNRLCGKKKCTPPSRWQIIW